MREMIDAGISLEEILTNIEAEYNEAAALKQKEEERERKDKIADAKDMLAEALIHYFDAIGLKNCAADRAEMVKMIEEAEGPIHSLIKLDQMVSDFRKQKKEEKEEVKVSMPYDNFFKALVNAGLM